MSRHVTLFHCPHTRSSGVLTLLEELGADYELHLMNMHKGEQRQPAYLAINPMGKVPALRHGETIITEQVAVYLYLADLYADAGLTPAVEPAARHLPALDGVLRHLLRTGGGGPRAATRAGGALPLALRRLRHCARYPGRAPQGRTWMLGDSYSVADVLWGTALNWTMAFGLIPERPVFRAYVERFLARPRCNGPGPGRRARREPEGGMRRNGGMPAHSAPR